MRRNEANDLPSRSGALGNAAEIADHLPKCPKAYKCSLWFAIAFSGYSGEDNTLMLCTSGISGTKAEIDKHMPDCPNRQRQKGTYRGRQGHPSVTPGTRMTSPGNHFLRRMSSNGSLNSNNSSPPVSRNSSQVRGHSGAQLPSAYPGPIAGSSGSKRPR